MPGIITSRSTASKARGVQRLDAGGPVEAGVTWTPFWPS